MRRKYDILWKGILEEVFDDMLRFIFPDIEKELDMQRGFEFLDKELSEMYPEPEKVSHTRVVDKLAKVYTWDGEERWMLIHIEVQGKNEPTFPNRMFQYYYRTLDRCKRPVTAIAIFTCRDGKMIPDRFEHHCLGTHLVYQFNTMWIMDYPDELLVASNNPFAIVVMVAKMVLLKSKGEELDKELLKQKLLIVRLLYKKKLFSKAKIEAIMTFLNNYVLFKNPQINHTFMEQVDQITGKMNTMGIIEQLAEIKAEEALAKGRLEEKENSVKAFLNNTEFPINKIASILGVSVSFVKKVKSHLISKPALP